MVGCSCFRGVERATFGSDESTKSAPPFLLGGRIEYEFARGGSQNAPKRLKRKRKKERKKEKKRSEQEEATDSDVG